MKRYLFLSPFLLILLFSCFKKGINSEIITYTDPLWPSDSTWITLKSGAVVLKRGNHYIWMGDILLDSLQLKTLDETGDIFKSVPDIVGPNINTHPATGLPMDLFTNNNTILRSVSIYPTSYNLWAMVRYVLNPSLTSDRLYIIKQAIAHWEANTNVRFYNATGQPTVDPIYGFTYPYVEFVNGTTNQSSVGRIGGRQELRLAFYQDVNAAIHEIGHAVGLLHEQSRNDRDSYISIKWSNIHPSKHYNFEKRTSNYYMIGGLDYTSIMMYGSYTTDTSFAIDTTLPIMTQLNGSIFNGGSVLSNNDRAWANSFYLPYKARSDTYRELDDIVYKSDNTIMTAAEKCQLQASLNNGNPCPPGVPCVSCSPGGID